MKYKRLLPCIVLYLLWGVTGQAQDMYVIKTNGAQTSFPVDEIDKITFPQNENMQIKKTSGSTTSYTISGIQKLTFYNIQSSIAKADPTYANQNSGINAYPNPADHMLTLAFSLPQKAKVSIYIYDIHGKLVRNEYLGQRETGMNEYIWHLENNAGQRVHKGMYACMVSNEKKSLKKQVFITVK